MQDDSWIKSLKPGDNVAVWGGLSGRDLKLGKIHHITKTGRIVVNMGSIQTIFNPDGRERGTYDSYHSDKITEYTQEIATKIHTKKVTDELYHTVWTSVPLNKLDQIINVLKTTGE